MNGLIKFAAAFALFALAACGGRSDAPAPEASSTATVTVEITVPDATPTVYLTGNLDALGPWKPDAMALSGDGATRTTSVEAPRGHQFEYKFTLGSWSREATDEREISLPNFVATIDGDLTLSHDIARFERDPREIMADVEGSGVYGTLFYAPDTASAFLNLPRTVVVWLPPEYDQDPERRYPVIYMSDGQNLFDPRLANYGVDWGIDEAMAKGVAEGRFAPAIIVATFSTDERFQDYSPWHNAPDYARFLKEELIPQIDTNYRTLTGPENTFHMGSSMGGLLSFYLVKEHPDTFSACGCVSTHFPLSPAIVAEWTGAEGADPTPYVVTDIRNGDAMPAGQRLFFDFGTEGLDAGYAGPHAAVRDWLLAQGFVEGEDFIVREYAGADHNEQSWRERVGDQLEWLLGADKDAE